MSVTRLSDVCAFIQDKSNSVLGSRFWDCRIVVPVECGTKPDKLETRILALSKFRIFILVGKTPQTVKIERFFHILSIRSIQIINDNEVCFGLDETTAGKRRIFICSDTPSKELTVHLLSALKHYFPDINDVIKSVVELSPADLYSSFDSLPVSIPILACRSFRRSYAALCDYYEQPFREEVVWDVEKIYSTHRLKELRIEDFSHLLPRDLVPIVSVCQYSSYFEGILIDGIKLIPELVEVILGIIRRSQTLKTLVLRNCSLPRDFVSLFSTALQTNPNLPIETIDFSKNVIDDKKGFVALNSLLSRMSQLKSLIFSECGIAEKSVNLIGAGLLQGVQPNSGVKQLQLTCLDLSGNTIKDDVNDFLQFMSLCESLRTLNLSDTNFSVDKLWGTLRFGGLQIETLKLSGCQCSRRNKEALQHMKEYFGSAVALRHIDFSNTVLGSEAVKHLLIGLINNQQLKPYTLILDSVADKGFAQALEGTLCDLDAESLSLRDNALEADAFSVVSSCRLMGFLTSLDLSGSNFVSLKRSAKHHGLLTNIMLELVKLVGEENSKLTKLVLSDCRLGTHLSVLLNALGVSSSLQLLDVTGNEMGNFGARLLAKALQVNVSLRTILIDRNQITGDGYTDIAHALALNTTLTSFVYPIIDAADSLSRADRTKTISALAEIETAVTKNRMGVRKEDAYYKMMLSNIQQDLFGRVDSDWKVPELNEKFVKIIDKLPLDKDNNEGTAKEVEHLLDTMAEKALAKAKDALAPVTDVAKSEKIDFNYFVPKRNEALREIIISSSVDYVNQMKWESIEKTTGDVLVALRSLDAEGRSQTAIPMSPSISSGLDTTESALSEKFRRPNEDEGADYGELGLDMDSSPSSSFLKHVNKARPKRYVRGKAGECEDSKSADSVSERSVASEASSSQREERPPVAMPRHTVMMTTTTTTQLSPPPIVPRRHRVAALQQPPMLPPKPSASQRSLNSLED